MPRAAPLPNRFEGGAARIWRQLPLRIRRLGRWHCRLWRRRCGCRRLARCLPAKHAVEPSLLPPATAVSLALDHGEDGGNDNQNQKKTHAGTLPVGPGVKYTNADETKRAASAYYRLSQPSKALGGQRLNGERY